MSTPPRTPVQALPAHAQGASQDPQTAWERRDMGVAAPQGLHGGAFHGPTPNQIPGGQLITTKGLQPLLQQGVQVHVFDVLGGPESLPNAIPAVWASQPGSFDDATQRQMGQMLRQVSRGKTDAPLVFYCQSAECWMSYNAALRAIRLGYRNVLWYRGGVEAWKSAGLPLGPSADAGQAQVGRQQGRRPPGALPPDAFGPNGGRP
jgi:PQQ-dependent catabolism-associated CXXCW motif protein